MSPTSPRTGLTGTASDDRREPDRRGGSGPGASPADDRTPTPGSDVRPVRAPPLPRTSERPVTLWLIAGAAVRDLAHRPRPVGGGPRLHRPRRHRHPRGHRQPASRLVDADRPAASTGSPPAGPSRSSASARSSPWWCSGAGATCSRSSAACSSSRSSAAIIYTNFARPRPYGVTVIGRWAGFSFPSPPVGRAGGRAHRRRVHPRRAGAPRQLAKLVVAVVLAIVAGPVCTSGSTIPPTSSSALILGDRRSGRSPSVGSRPTRPFPVAYRKGKTAHLDVTGAAGRGHPRGDRRPARR